ncbi:hypothetical protein [Saccharopolyspora shandongensis]|uniref:hypothetical protein n=1 Tax=Saccharopolyspora shandongensis TaxID=418495 RepID=UPI003408C184
MGGTKVGTWVSMDECSISYTVCQDEVEFEIGGQSGFDLFTTEAGLAKLVAKATDALRELRELRAQEEQ